MKMLKSAAFNERHPDESESATLCQFIGTPGTGKSVLSWIIFLFCVAHDINSAVTCGTNRLVFAAGKFSRYEFDCYKHSDINSLFSVPEFTRKETFVNLFDLMDECTIDGIIRRGNSEFNCKLGFRFEDNDQRQLAISFFSSQQKVAYN